MEEVKVREVAAEAVEASAKESSDHEDGEKCEFCGDVHPKSKDDSSEGKEAKVGFHFEVELGIRPEGSCDKLTEGITELLNTTKPDPNVIFFAFAQVVGVAAARADIDLVNTVQMAVIIITEAYKREKESDSSKTREALKGLLQMLTSKSK